ncbi:iron ABC transporter permease [Epibacterium sp. SM1979]|uniref:Iron ABC transporter permease n=1 Tax=Tritonibacter litoralis TaxID=2662264 RepID=A0A843Y844_9RHOB|nr:lipocalin-like domain-containing protein [Tritonibacter litoralis]MQQ07161.1 iron ABC transporter permease [Tritonibacter litoralis]
MSVRLLFAMLLALLPGSGFAQGYAGLGQKAGDGFQNPDPTLAPAFPQDHGPHPDFRIEWWYVTANLQDADGQDYGIQWTLFRSAVRPYETDGWDSPQYWLAHAALTTPETHQVAEKLSRGGIGQAGVSVDPFAAWIDDWHMHGADASLDALQLSANGDDFSYDLQLTATGPLVLQGENGYSVKSQSGQASYYYSQPHFEVTGVVSPDGSAIPVTGQAWLDREWSSQPLDEGQSGWDWFSLRFEDGTKLMGFLLRGTSGVYSSGTWIDQTGQAFPLPVGAFAAKPLRFESAVSDDIPTTWHVKLPDRGVDIQVTAINPNAWMATSFSYWEGPVQVTGSHSGKGYLEMTGYGP